MKSAILEPTLDSKRGFSRRELEQLSESLHLQWFFAAEDEGRSEEPTEQKIRKAREEGKVPRSADFSVALSLLFLTVTLIITAPFFYRRLVEFLKNIFFQVSQQALSASLLMELIRFLFLSLLPFLTVAVSIPFLSGQLQHGWVFSFKPLEPRLERIIPKFSQWLKRAFGWPEGVYNLSKNIIRTLIIMVLVTLIIRWQFSNFFFASQTSLENALTSIAKAAMFFLFSASFLMLLISFFDLIFQKTQYKQNLKMSRQEVKEEQKQTDGDPVIRNQLRRRMREMINASLPLIVQNSTVVIVNPTHISVVIGWDENTMEAPTVTSKGHEELALRIRSLAKLYRIPVMENKPLARSLYRHVKVGQMIPSEYWELMSQILAQVYRLAESKEHH